MEMIINSIKLVITRVPTTFNFDLSKKVFFSKTFVSKLAVNENSFFRIHR